MRRTRVHGRILVLGLAIILSAASCATVPVTGRKSFILVSEGEEMALGSDSYRQVLSQSEVVSSGPNADMVRRVGQRIAKICDRPDYAWEFALIRDDATLNAFCLPGGKVAVYTGILKVTQTEAGLATVMGHEIAHAIARHGGERMTDQLALQLGGVGLSTLLKDKSPAARDMVLAAYGVGGQVGMLLPFGRSQESEADHIGLIYMARAGYDPREAIEFWKRMETLASGQAPPEWLSTHPSHGKRVKGLETWLPEAIREYEAAKK
jgi:predicted Zn-dependent protease